MKVGDLVYIINSSRPCIAGIIVNTQSETGWYEVLCEDGKVIMWPSEQMKIVSETLEKEIEEIALAFADL